MKVSTRCSGVDCYVPLVYPESAEVKVLEDEQAVRNAQRLQTHRAISHHRCFRCERVRDAQRVLTTNRIEGKTNRSAARRAFHFVAKILAVDEDDVAAVGTQFFNQFLSPNDVDALVTEVVCNLDRGPARGRVRCV